MTNTVLDYLQGRGVPFLVLPRPHAAGPEQTAAAHGVDTAELVRSHALMYRFGAAVMVTPWTRPLDLDLARTALDDRGARFAELHELQGLAAGCTPDSLPPLGLWLQAPLFVDLAVSRLTQVVFPAGRAATLVCMQRTDLFRDEPYAVSVLTDASRHEAARAGLLTAAAARALTEEDLLPVHVVERRRAGRERSGAA